MSCHFAVALVLVCLFPLGMKGQYSIEWAKTYGGSQDENAYRAKQTKDGGYVVVGDTKSNDGDLSGNHGNKDAWVLKLDKKGAIKWSKNFGGSERDFAWDILETEDGGYLVACSSHSIDGDFANTKGGNDCWMLKLNSKGEREWLRNYGGTDNDACRSLENSGDGNYFFIGSTQSNDGDVPPVHGSSDIWLTKFDPHGNILWSKVYGGTGSDAGSDLHVLEGGGMVADGNESVDEGNGEMKQYNWLAGLDKEGQILWENIMPETLSDFAVDFDNKIIGVGIFDDPDVILNYVGDILVKKFNAQGGNIEGGGIYGGSYRDSGWGVQPLKTGEYLIAGNSASSDGDVGGNYGLFDWWLFVIDNAGAIKWEQNFGGSRGEFLHSIEPTTDGGFILAGQTTSDDGDVVSERYSAEAWIVKIGPDNVSGKCAKPVIFPNPAIGGELKVQVVEGFGENGYLKIFDAMGRLVLFLRPEKLEHKGVVEIPLSYLPSAGVYFVQINCGDETHSEVLVYFKE